MYSGFLRVLGVTAWTLEAFNKSYTLLAYGWAYCFCNLRSCAMVKNDWSGTFSGTYRFLPCFINFVFHLSSYVNECCLMIKHDSISVLLYYQKNMFLPSRLSRPNKAGMFKSTTSSSFGFSCTCPCVGTYSSIIPSDLMFLSPNWKSLSNRINITELHPENQIILLGALSPMHEIAAPVSMQNSIGSIILNW